MTDIISRERRLRRAIHAALRLLQREPLGQRQTTAAEVARVLGRAVQPKVRTK